MSQSIDELGVRRHLRLYLMRHGEVDRRGAAHYGHTDIMLSARGLEQSRRMCEALTSAPLHGVYSSDLTRAIHTAELIARTHGLSPVRLPALQEIDMGEWEGRALADIATAHPDMVAQLFDNPREFQYPGGESFSRFEQRVNRALEGILRVHEAGAVAIVTHGGVCRAIIGSVLELAPKNWLRLAQDFGCLNVIDWYDSCPFVRKLNYTPGDFV